MYKDLVAMPERKNLLERHKSGWEYDIELDFSRNKMGGRVLNSFGPEGQVEVRKRVITELLSGGVVLLRYQ